MLKNTVRTDDEWNGEILNNISKDSKEKENHFSWRFGEITGS